ncbi:hypothetical protein [Microcoleus sp. FACHB-672]|uniref:hypothetical protein n=1 Tax=Microcoleus sp. FACHB-672 TaxID=2692825 RepID=UPI0019B8982F|nr:hypothetical protein [Microcoleus sp. FACHB-672]MBD2039790.1 hypothetical protein [Microcoleus sp. FACHB-672]
MTSHLLQQIKPLNTSTERRITSLHEVREFLFCRQEANTTLQWYPLLPQKVLLSCRQNSYKLSINKLSLRARKLANTNP